MSFGLAEHFALPASSKFLFTANFDVHWETHNQEIKTVYLDIIINWVYSLELLCVPTEVSKHFELNPALQTLAIDRNANCNIRVKSLRVYKNFKYCYDHCLYHKSHKKWCKQVYAFVIFIVNRNIAKGASTLDVPNVISDRTKGDSTLQ